MNHRGHSAPRKTKKEYKRKEKAFVKINTSSGRIKHTRAPLKRKH